MWCYDIRPEIDWNVYLPVSFTNIKNGRLVIGHTLE